MPIKQKPHKKEETSFVNYEVAGPVASAFHDDRSFFRGLMGPVGSGKSVACCIEMFKKSMERPTGISGWKKARWIAVRNTGPELETTTIKTWLDWFPEEVFGKMNRKPPITHRIKIDDLQLDLEIIFLALDRDEDMKKLLSLEATGIWLNEARFIQKSILDAATGRVGRYPSKKDKPENMSEDKWLPWYGIIADTNPPDDTHWWYNLAEEEKPEGFKFFKQPSGFSEHAENKHNLPIRYYETQQAGKTKEYIDVFLHGNYGFISNGQPVYGDNFNDLIHVSEHPLKILPMLVIYCGVDFGLTPCCVFGQRTVEGQWQIIAEIVTPKGETIALPQFANIMKSFIASNFNNNQVIIYGDPAGGFRDQQGMTAYDIFRAKGVVIRPAPTNYFEPRREAVLQPLMRMINGKPGFLLDKKCRMLRKGFNGQYRYRKLSVSGDAKFTQEPDKNEYSHPHDALQYLLCGGGEYKELKVGKNAATGKTYSAKQWKVI